MAGPSSGDWFSRARKWRKVFLVTILLRTWFSVSPSYIHPDEHFQGPEALADTIFGWASKKSWEFTADHPARSFMSIWAVYGIPMSFVQALYGEHGHITPMTMFYILRMGFAIGTWVLCDMAIDRLTLNKQEKIKSMVFVATSYVTWTLQSHTFSNSVETVLLLWCLVIIHELQHARSNLFLRHFDMAMLGAMIAFGVFNRITFPAFLILPGLTLLQHFRQNPMTIVSFAASGLATAALAISIDTWCYGSPHYIATPVNNVLYNLDSANLAQHGLHSRFNHLLVNVPQLLGPGILLLFSKRYLKSLPMQAAVSGLVVLSIFPHQEPRFLIPIVPLLCCCFDTNQLSHLTVQGIFTAWCIFNLVLGVLMGNLHQGGVLPAQSYIGQNLAKDNNTFIWWKTYSPPMWILGRPVDSVSCVDPLVHGTDQERYSPVFEHLGSNTYQKSVENKMTVVDLMGCRVDWVTDAMSSVSKASAMSPDKLRRAFFVAPRAAVQSTPELAQLLDRNKSQGQKRGYRLNQVWSTNWHLSMESLDFENPATLAPGLAIWEIQSI